MEIIATLPPPHLRQSGIVAGHELVNSARFNVGARSPYGPRETLERALGKMGGKKLWIDLKGRQLRIVQWALPTYGDIILNHRVSVDLPAEIYFRGDQKASIRHINGQAIFVEPNPPQAVGAGQSVNICGENLRIEGYLTSEDVGYIEAAKALGIHDYMLSFVESGQDIDDVMALDPEAVIIAKIESRPGIDFLSQDYADYRGQVQLMAARDDLFINIGLDILEALPLIISKDREAIVASRILESCRQSEAVSLADLSDLRWLEALGYRRLLLSDSLCFEPKAFARAMAVMAKIYQQY